MKNLLLAILVVLLLIACATFASAGELPSEPLEVGHEPQFVFDLHVVDTTWGLKLKGEPIKRVLHQPRKHPANPLMAGDDPSHLWMVREAYPFCGRSPDRATRLTVGLPERPARVE